MGWDYYFGNLLYFTFNHPVVWLPAAFILGAIAGSFLNVCIYRLPLHKSILWPGSHCGSCFQPIPGVDNIPLVSYLRLRGRCRACGTRFSSRYFWVELLTATGFAGLFWADVVANLGAAGWVPTSQFAYVSRGPMVGVWLAHAVFLSFLIVAAFTDIDQRRIPAAVPIFGTLFAFITAALGPWPWPLEPRFWSARNLWQQASLGTLGVRDQQWVLLPSGLQPRPLWLPTPAWLQPGTWQLGLATALVGAGFGVGILILMRSIFRLTLNRPVMRMEEVYLLLMIGAFLGWQAVLCVVVLTVPLALIYAPVLYFGSRKCPFPFAPFLAIGAVLTLLLPWWFDQPLLNRLKAFLALE